MNEQKLEKQRRNLVDRGLLSPDEKRYGSSTINYTEKLAGLWYQNKQILEYTIPKAQMYLARKYPEPVAFLNDMFTANYRSYPWIGLDEVPCHLIPPEWGELLYL